jgi:hypothetical protein
VRDPLLLCNAVKLGSSGVIAVGVLTLQSAGGVYARSVASTVADIIMPALNDAGGSQFAYGLVAEFSIS